jgi:hypothetical protein
MKSERHAERIASRSASVGCCAATGAKTGTMRRLASKNDPQIFNILILVSTKT